MTNTMFPGRPDYAGPVTGMFGLLHHEVLCEYSHDVMERVAYIKQHKPRDERAIRLHNLIYLGACSAATDYQAKRAPLDADWQAKRALLDADYQAKCALLDADYQAKRAPLDADHQAKCASLDADWQAKCAPLDAEILVYIKWYIPDCAWNGKTLVFK